MMAPAPVTPVLNTRVTGPFPEFPASEVPSRLSEAEKPIPVQLHGAAGHTTEIRLLAPVKVPATVSPPTEVAFKPVPSSVASAPNCDQITKSFAACPVRLVTTTRLSARAALAMNTVKTIRPHSLQEEARLSIEASLQPRRS